MQNALNPIVDLYQSQLEASRQVANALFSGTEKLDRVVMETTHKAFDDQLKYVQALTATRDPQSFANAQNTFFPRPENAVNCQKEIMRIFAEMQNDIGRSMQSYVEQVSGKAGGVNPFSGRQSANAYNP